MLKIKPYKQSIGYCGPASLKMVLSYYGIDKSEKELAKLSGCKASKGVEAEGLLSAVKKLGLKGIIKDFSDFKDIRHYVLKKKIPVIVDWFSTDDGHYSVVVNIDNSKIYLLDPETARLKSIKLNDFKRIWFDFPNKFIKSKSELLVRRLLVVHK